MELDHTRCDNCGQHPDRHTRVIQWDGAALGTSFLVCPGFVFKPKQIIKEPGCTVNHPGSSCNVACGYP